MVFDTELFIVEIQKRPSIWNIHTEEYNNKMLRQNAWVQIAECLYPDYVNLEEANKIKRISDLQRKWKGLRDYFKREKKILPKPGLMAKKRKALYLDMLQFLAVTKTPRNPPKSNPPPITHTVTSHTTTVSHTPTAQEEDRAYKPSLHENMDPDMNFLLNILPDMKSMDQRQNFEFRFGVMNLIKDIRYSEPFQSYVQSINNYRPVQNNIVDVYLEDVNKSSPNSVTSDEDIKDVLVRDDSTSN